MEKQEAIREWCIERAVELCLSNKGAIAISVKGVIATAEEIEKYINSSASSTQMGR